MIQMDSTKPIYIQIAEWIENEIIADIFIQDSKVYSQYQLAELFNINPATAAKGLALLAEDKILYKKRGLGMFVTPEAKAKILDKRKNGKLTSLAEELVREAKRLLVTEEQLMELIRKLNREGVE